MKPFDPKSICAKCGHDQAGTIYLSALPFAALVAKQGPMEEEVPGECLKRTCLRCGFAWNEACVNVSVALEEEVVPVTALNWSSYEEDKILSEEDRNHWTRVLLKPPHGNGSWTLSGASLIIRVKTEGGVKVFDCCVLRSAFISRPLAQTFPSEASQGGGVVGPIPFVDPRIQRIDWEMLWKVFKKEGWMSGTGMDRPAESFPWRGKVENLVCVQIGAPPCGPAIDWRGVWWHFDELVASMGGRISDSWRSQIRSLVEDLPLKEEIAFAPSRVRIDWERVWKLTDAKTGGFPSAWKRPIEEFVEGQLAEGAPGKKQIPVPKPSKLER